MFLLSKRKLLVEFSLASSNPHKLEELSAYFKNSNIELNSAPEKLEIIEDGDTFRENAFKKAEGYFNQYKTPILADDSGLILDCREDILGVHSARFAPDFPDYKNKNQELLKVLEGETNRNAYFICILCFYISPEEVYFFEGRLAGIIGSEAKGDQGFGYDPVFYPERQDGKSLAEIPEWKSENSHRIKAVKQAESFFKSSNKL